MMSFMYHNSRSASRYPLRSLNHKISRLNSIYFMRSIQSKFLIPRKEVLEGRKLKCTKSNGIIILRKKLLGRLKFFSKETFPTFLEQIQVNFMSLMDENRNPYPMALRHQKPCCRMLQRSSKPELQRTRIQ